MQKKVVKFSVLPAVLALLFFSFSAKKDYELKKEKSPAVSKPVIEAGAAVFYTVDSTNFNFPVLKNNFLGFKAALGFQESQNDYDRVNVYGYLGKYQFSRATLAMLGVHDVHKFMNTPKLQEAAFRTYIARNKWVLRRTIKQYSGKVVNGVKVTPSGILAAAHLAGPGGVRRYLHSNGQNGVSDAFGTSIAHYLHEFGGYDLSFIDAEKNAQVEWPA